MPKYRTRWFEVDLGHDAASPVRARGWSAALREFKAIQTSKRHASEQARFAHHARVVVSTRRLDAQRLQVTYAPELIIEAPNRPTAQRALNLIGAADSLSRGELMFEADWAVVPDNPNQTEGMHAQQIESALGQSAATSGYLRAASIAAKATNKTRWTYAVSKHWASLRTCSIPTMEHHPRYGSRFGVEQDPLNVAVMAQAIITAFSVIEELGLDVRASREQPSKLPTGQWNPPVLANLRHRLLQAGIDEWDKMSWMLRGTPTRIERQHPPPTGKPATWSRYRIRDRSVEVVDAIQYASVLRSRVSAHATGKLTRSLTMMDVTNVQHLARRLTLEVMGFWDRV